MLNRPECQKEFASNNQVFTSAVSKTAYVMFCNGPVNTVEELLLEFRNSEREFSQIIIEFTDEFVDDNFDVEFYVDSYIYFVRVE